MKTEATRPGEAERSRAPDEPRSEAAGRSFPEVLGQASAGSTPAPDTGAASLGEAAEGPDGAGTSAFVTLAAALATQALVASHPLATRRGGGDPGAPPRRPHDDPLDPTMRQVAHFAPPLAMGPPEAASFQTDAQVQARAQASLEDVLPAIVRRIAWAGDGRKGSLRLEFGAGALAGGTLVVHADDGRVRVELHAPSGTDAAAWRDRIAARLEEKRITVDEIVVQ